ncbi:MAG TPA: response regulator [Verrucomicrobiae bacterium]|nr:response regulator [Verrucomicrobiae bacterium]
MANTDRELWVLGLGDDTGRGEIIRSYLSHAGYRSRSATVADLAAGRPLGIVLDLSLLSEDGWEILLRLKKDPAYRDIPVLPVYLSEEGKVGGVFHVAGFFVQPVEPAYLSRKLAVLGLTEDVDMYDLQVMIISRRGEETVEKAVEHAGFSVENAYTGKEGLALGTIKPPYLFFSQMMLPDMTCFELLEKFRLYPQLRNVPFFVLMKSEYKEDEKKALANGIADLVRKKELTREEFLISFRRRA